MRCGLLGPFEVRDSVGTALALPARMQRTIVAALLLRADEPVSTERLIEVLWDGDEPASARASLFNYVARLRRALGPEVGARLRSVRSGYLFAVEDASELDLMVFDGLRADGEAAARAADWERASRAMTRALALWRGEPLADLRQTARVTDEQRRLSQLRLHALQLRVEADLHLGLHEQLTVELRQLVAAHPLRERFHAQLMFALYRAGRRAEALQAYSEARRVLVAEVGIEPGEELQALQRRILTAQEDVSAPAERDRQAISARSPEAGTPQARSSQALPPRTPSPRTRPSKAPAAIIRDDLPRDTVHFVGRAQELDEMTGRPGTWIIDGMAGVGKTALAVRTARRMAAAYPEGQLYVDLHGHTAGRTPTNPFTALESLLGAMNVPTARIPENADERGALFRAELARRRVVVVLDNAADADQVRPLLAGAPGSAMLVTSRRRLVGLADVHALSLGVLRPDEAVELFAGIVGEQRCAAEPAACAEVVRYCGGLPLAVRICAARLRHRPAWTVSHLVRRLRAESQRLALLDAGGDGVTASLSLSVRHLDSAAHRFFALLGSAPGPDIDAYVAAALADSPLDEAEDLLEGLVDVNLVEQPREGLYRLHALTRDYAGSLPTPERDAARTRMLDYYLSCTIQAIRTIARVDATPWATTPPDDAVPPRHQPEFADAAAAGRWLVGELGNLIGVTARPWTPDRRAALPSW